MATALKELGEDGVRGRGRPRDEVARARILEAALELLETVGFASATTDAIAERAGASKATIYRWWPNKAAVLIEALREAVAQEMPFPDTGDLRQDLHLQLRNVVKLLAGPRGRAFKAFIAAAQSDGEVAAAFRSVWVLPRRATAKIVLAKHQEEGRLAKHLSLDLVLDLLYGPLYFRLLAGHGTLTPADTAAIADLVIDGLQQC